jgi:L-fucose isomerase-like protein
MLSMALSDAVTGVSGFQANPASIDLDTGKIIFAHCTIPLNMVRSYSFSTHFESGLGIGIHGEMEEGTVTILKLSGSVDRMFVQEALLEGNQYEKNLCRTQLVLRIPEPLRRAVLGDYFLRNPIGNHHIIVPGAWAEVFEAYFLSVSQK